MSAIARTVDPIALLRRIERLSLEAGHDMPVQEADQAGFWPGIGFRLGGFDLITATAEVVEIMTIPSMTRVPGAKAWVKGIANVRGNLLPILDTKGFMHGEVSVPGRRTRLLVIDFEGLRAGLMVDEVLGLRQFLVERKSADLPKVDSWLSPFLVGSIQDTGGTWGVFSMRKLAEDPKFLAAAA